MRHRAIFFFLFICIGSKLVSASSLTPFYQPFKKVPIVYKGSYFGFSDHGVFSITNAKDHVNWSSSDRVSTGSPLVVHFNHVLFINDQKNLIALDTQFGHKLWEYKGADINRFDVSYPQLVYLTKGDDVGAVDFMSGKKLWQKKFKTVEDVALLGQSGLVGIMTSGNLFLVYAHDGSDVSKVVLPKLQLTILSKWNNGLVFGNGSEFYTYLLNKNTFVKSSVVPTLNGKWVDEHYYLTYDATKHVLKSIEIETNHVTWIEPGVPTGSVVFFAPPYVIAQTPSKNLMIYHINRHGALGSSSLDEGEALDMKRGFYVDLTDIYMVSTLNCRILPMGTKKSTKWMRVPWANIR